MCKMYVAFRKWFRLKFGPNHIHWFASGVIFYAFCIYIAAPNAFKCDSFNFHQDFCCFQPLYICIDSNIFAVVAIVVVIFLIADAADAAAFFSLSRKKKNLFYLSTIYTILLMSQSTNNGRMDCFSEAVTHLHCVLYVTMSTYELAIIMIALIMMVDSGFKWHIWRKKHMHIRDRERWR